MERHALLSPSGASRWLNCTPSAKLESLEPYKPSSTYAVEGTDAHFLSELKLAYMLKQISVAEYDTRFENFVMNSQFYNAEFNEYVNDYCQEVMAIIHEDYGGQQIEVYLEQRVEFGDVVPEGSGTGDVIIVGKTFVHVIDLKFGKGVPVSAIDNPQLKLYALGALKKFRLKGVFTDALMTIIQPRLYDKTTARMAVTELYEWAELFVKPRAELAYAGKGELTPGDHCKFCKLKGKCEALGNAQLEVAKREFETVVVEKEILEPRDMSPEMLSKIMTIAPKFIDWFKDVNSYTVSAMINHGLKIPGFKVVEGRSTRFIANEDAVYDLLHTKGFPDSDILEPRELLGITKLEKNIGKKLFNDLAKDYIIKPVGKPTVAPESDNRAAIDTSQYTLIGQEFEDDYSED